jgi:hypothetical protein
MRRALCLVPLLVLAAACSPEGPRKTYKPPMEGQSPPPPVKKPEDIPLPTPTSANSPVLDSPVWLRANAPVEWTCPAGWEQILSERPTRLVEFTILKEGPGKVPLQFLVLRGVDEKPGGNEYNVNRWAANFQIDSAPTMNSFETNGVKVIKWKYRGRYQGYIAIGSGEPVDEADWTMICGWIEAPAGSLLYKIVGPNDIIAQQEPKVDELLKSMRVREQKQ